jgi:hypothetical protein
MQSRSCSCAAGPDSRVSSLQPASPRSNALLDGRQALARQVCLATIVKARTRPLWDLHEQLLIVLGVQLLDSVEPLAFVAIAPSIFALEWARDNIEPVLTNMVIMRLVGPGDAVPAVLEAVGTALILVEILVYALFANGSQISLEGIVRAHSCQVFEH